MAEDKRKRVLPPFMFWEKGFARKPEVLLISSIAGISRREAATACMEFFEWADSVSENGRFAALSVRNLSAIFPDLVHEFWDGMVRAGWLVATPEGLELSNYDRWMGSNAKRRLMEARRKADSRQNPTTTGAICPQPVRNLSRSEQGICALEKEIEKEKDKNTNPPSRPPTGEAGASKVKAILSQHQAERFGRFWSAYPRKTGRGAAERWWDRHKPDDALLALILQAVEAHRTCETWQRGFVPHPTTWLNQRRWQDEPASAQPAPSQPRDARAIMDAARARMDMLIAGPQPSPETRSGP
jgi:hypothetical protein